MLDLIKPLKAESLKDRCVEQLEELILSERVPPGEMLPPERDLARQLEVSRPVVHDALVDLAAKGLVSQIPRVGTVVNDFRTHGSLALLNSLVNYQGDHLSPRMLDSLLAMRLLFETEVARLAAVRSTKEHRDTLKDIYQKERQVDPGDTQRITQLDFDFHHRLAMASDNLAYPLFLNSFKPVYTRLTGLFFLDPTVIPDVVAYHGRLIDAIERKDPSAAVEIMQRMLSHGENNLRASWDNGGEH